MNISENIFGIILAGGSGSRLWPLSREYYPKQFLKFSEEQTLLQLTYQRLKRFTESENILIITNNKHESGINFQLNEIEESSEYRVIGEPSARNTAPALAFGLCHISMQLNGDEDPVIIVAPSDHLIKNEIKFTEAVLEGAEIAKQGYIVTFGIRPSAPETGYGYIKVLTDQKISKTGIKTDCFKEKPDHTTAVKYVESGEYFWNSGIFMFKLSTILEEFKISQPQILEEIEKIDFNNPDSIRDGYEKIASISIDYAIMEKSDKIVLIPAEFDWNDLGAWQAVYEVSPKNNDNNVINGDVIDIDCKDSLFYSSSRLVSAIGIKNSIIVETDDAVLVCDRESSQQVKKAFDRLKNEKSEICQTHKVCIENWGTIHNLVKNQDMVINNILIRENHELTMDSTDRTLKHYYIAEGTAIFKTESGVKLFNMGQSLDIKDEPLYSVKNSGEEDLKIVEIMRF